MMKIEEKRKQFKLNSVTLDKIQKLKNAKVLENPGIKIYEKDIVIQAIDLAYSAKFGKDVFDETIERLDTVISNSVHKLLLEHLNPMAEAFSNLYHQEELNKEAMLLILRANNVVRKEEEGIFQQLLKNESLEEVITAALRKKKEVLKEYE